MALLAAKDDTPRATAAEAGFKRVAIIAPSARAIARARDGLIRDMVSRRHRVLAIARDVEAGDAQALAALGADVKQLIVKPPLISALADHAEIAALAQLLADWQPHSVLASGGHIGAIGALAAARARVPHNLLLVNGLGGGDVGSAGRLLRKAVKAASGVMFHNRDDAKAVTEAGLLPAGLKCTIVPGAGVDLERYRPLPLPPFADGLVFAMVSRLTRAHGVPEFLAAARLVKASAARAQFLLAGPIDKADDGLAKEIAAAAGNVTYLGDVVDVTSVHARAHVAVYPSRGEGAPRAVMEAMASARPILTTDSAGCRDMVDERVNGCLVLAGDAAKLAAGMESFLKRPDLIPAMARASRGKAERLFDERDASRATLEALALA